MGSPIEAPQAQPEFAPVLVLLPPENAPAFRDLNAGQSISCAYNRLDIRQLDKFLSTILMGKTTSLADIDTQRKTRVSFDTVKAVASQRNQAGAVAGDAKAAQEGPQPAATPSSVEETP